MISMDSFAAFCLAMFSLAAAGFLFSGNMLRKLMFSVIMCLAAAIMLACLVPEEKMRYYYLAVFLILIGEIISSIFIVSEAVRSMRTLDSGALRENK